MILIISSFNFPISRYSFLLKAIKRLYLAKTKDENILSKIKNKKLLKHKNLIYLKKTNVPD